MSSFPSRYEPLKWKRDIEGGREIFHIDQIPELLSQSAFKRLDFLLSPEFSARNLTRETGEYHEKKMRLEPGKHGLKCSLSTITKWS